MSAPTLTKPQQRTLRQIVLGTLEGGKHVRPRRSGSLVAARSLARMEPPLVAPGVGGRGYLATSAGVEVMRELDSSAEGI